MENFVYETPTKVYFGKEEELNVGKIIAGYAPKKVLVHFGGQSARKSGLLDRVEKALEAEGIAYVELGGVTANPELKLVREGIALCQREGVDFVLAVGGGSVLDSSKDIANGVANPDIDVWDFSLGKCVPQKTLHKGAILTLAAAGSEMSNSCVITNTETNEKRGYGCSCNRMDFAVENPELTYTVSPYQTACGIVDIAMHTIERYFCPGEDTYLTDAIAEAVIKNVMKAGKDCLADPEKDVNGVFDYDRSKLIFSTVNSTLTGAQLYDILLERYHIQMEMETETYSLALAAVGDREEGFERLCQAIEEIDREEEQKVKKLNLTGMEERKMDAKSMYCVLNQVISISEAMETESESCILEECIGRISAEFAYLYPPGIPLLTPGEQITGQFIRNIKIYTEEGLYLQGLEDYTNQSIRVVKQTTKEQYEETNG